MIGPLATPERQLYDLLFARHLKDGLTDQEVILGQMNALLINDILHFPRTFRL